MKLFANDAPLRAADHTRNLMKTLPFLAALCVSTLAGFAPVSSRAADDEGVALAIVYDTSGSMRESVKDVNGKTSPKYIIANRALAAIAKQIQSFATNSGGPPRKIEAGVFTFEHESAKEAVKFGPFDEAAIEGFARDYSNPSGNTPLGNALT